MREWCWDGPNERDRVYAYELTARDLQTLIVLKRAGQEDAVDNILRKVIANRKG